MISFYTSNERPHLQPPNTHKHQGWPIGIVFVQEEAHQKHTFQLLAFAMDRPQFPTAGTANLFGPEGWIQTMGVGHMTCKQC